MTTIASSLLDFLLSLFRDPAAAAAYAEDPRAALDSAGLYDVEPDDVAALQPMVEDSCSLGYGGGSGGGGDDYRPVHYGAKNDEREDDDNDNGGRPHGDGNYGGHDVVAVTHVKLVENKSITEVDVDIDARNSVWAGGDAIAIWGDDVVLATGGSVAAGDDVEDVEVDNSTEIELEDSFNDNSTTTNSNNTGTNIADRGGEVEDNDLSIDESFNGATVAGGDVDQSTEVEVDIEDSLNGNNVAGGDVTETEVEIDDSLNGNEVAGRDINETEVEIDDSFNPDDSFNTEDESVTIDDITVDASEDNSTEIEIEDSLNENAIAVDDALSNTGDVDIDD
jgi:hypothetical protein